MEFSAVETLRAQPFWVLLCFSLGTFSALKFSYYFLQSLYVFLLRPAKNLAEYGRWAVVTGPTDGIGKAMAFELARRGLNLVLVGRNPQKLTRVSSEIRAETPGVDLRTAVVDFAGDLGDGIKRLEDAIKEIEVGMLVNNAGLSHEKAMFLHEMDAELWGDMVKVNMVAPTVVAAAVLPGMLQRKKGAVINLGSASTTVPSYPLYSVYSSTKGYISQLSKSLYNEYKGTGIDVQCQMPWFVATNMIPTFSSSFFIATPSQYARAAVRSIGYGSQCIPYWTHVLQSHILSYPADWIMNWVNYNIMMTMRKEKKF